MMNTKINVFKNNGEWFYSMWIDGEFDHSAEIDTTETTKELVMNQVLKEFPEATIRYIWTGRE